MKDARSDQETPPGVLRAFRDVIAVDASVVKVHDNLRSVWKGTRRNSAKAALKLPALTADAHADCKSFGINHDLRGVLVLFDRGYASPSLWRRVDAVGGYFLCRIPKGWNQPIVVQHS